MDVLVDVVLDLDVDVDIDVDVDVDVDVPRATCTWDVAADTALVLLPFPFCAEIR